MRDRVTVLAPAKLNLALDVLGILPGGYHALDMTMQAISLYERVVIRRSPYLDLTLPGSNVKPGPGSGVGRLGGPGREQNAPRALCGLLRCV